MYVIEHSLDECAQGFSCERFDCTTARLALCDTLMGPGDDPPAPSHSQFAANISRLEEHSHETASPSGRGGDERHGIAEMPSGVVVNQTVEESALRELRTIDVTLRAALGRSTILVNDPYRKGSTLDLVSELIARENESRQLLATRLVKTNDGLQLSDASDQEDRPWETPTKAAVEKFAEELEVVLREKENAEMERNKALGQRRDFKLAYESQRARAAQSEKALHFAQGEIVRITKKVHELSTINSGLRGESAERWERVKRLEKRLKQIQAGEEEALQTIAMLRKDLQVERQMLKSRDVEMLRLQAAYRDANGDKRGSNALDDANLKRIADLENKIVQLAVSVSHKSEAPARSNERELNLIVQELAKEEVKSRARANAAEKLAGELRVELDAKTVEVIGLRQQLEDLDRSTSKKWGTQSQEMPKSIGARSYQTSSMEEVDRNLQESCNRAEQLCHRLSTVMGSAERLPSGPSFGDTSSEYSNRSQRVVGTPMSGVSDRSEERIRELEVALEQQHIRLDSAEKLAVKASSEAKAMREALRNAENIASAAAAVAQSRGLTGAYISRNIGAVSPLSTPLHSQIPVGSSPRTGSVSSSYHPPIGISKELEQARRTAEKERQKREEAEETLRRWSILEER